MPIHKLIVAAVQEAVTLTTTVLNLETTPEIRLAPVVPLHLTPVNTNQAVVLQASLPDGGPDKACPSWF